MTNDVTERGGGTKNLPEAADLRITCCYREVLRSIQDDTDNTELLQGRGGGGFIVGRFANTAGPIHAPHKPLDSATRINQALLAREERMALRAQIDADRRPGRPGRKGVATARAGDAAFYVFGMDIFFHFVPIRPPLSGVGGAPPLTAPGRYLT